uniref:MerR family transcriptional regulator n=1 Tax=Desulfobacca acetoxidans TaxID=60893 RepID=A0A7V4G8Q4_9BACT
MIGGNFDVEASDTLIFTRTVTAQLARVSLEFLELCEAEALVRPRPLGEGEVGYGAEDIERLSQIRRLHEMLGLDLPAVEIVLHLRDQVLSLLERLSDLERRFARREEELLREIEDLRRRVLTGAR